MNHYELATLIRVSCTFTRVDTGAVIDPTAITCWVRQPDCTIVGYTYADGSVVKDSEGKYHLDLDCTMAGVWNYKWEGTGPVEVGTPDTPFTVNQSKLIGSRWPSSCLLLVNGNVLIDDAGVTVA